MAGGNFRSFEIDTSELKRAEERLRQFPGSVPPVLARTLNRVGSMAQTKTNRALSEKMGLPARELRQFIQVYGANRSSLIWTMRGIGRPISLRAFAAVQRQKGVSARPWGERRIFRGTFIVESLGGSVYVRTGEFTRATKGRYKGQMRESIKKLWGPGVPKELASAVVVKVFQQTAQENFAPRLDHEITNALRKLSAR